MHCYINSIQYFLDANKKKTSTMNSTLDIHHDDTNGSLADDWENYKAYTRFYYITDEVFLYANPILILIGKSIDF